MVQNYSPEKLISIIYAEAPFQDYFELDEAMQKNETLANEFRSLYRSHKMLESLNLSPRRSVINRIVNYSKEPC